MAASDTEFELKFTGAAVDISAGAPASLLAEALEGLQRLVHLIGMRQEGRTLNLRARPSTDVLRRYVVLCSAAKVGSFVQPYRIGSLDDSLLSPQMVERASDSLQAILSAANDESEADLQAAVPDEIYRRHMMDAVFRMAPPVSSGVDLGVSRRSRSLFSAVRSRAFVEAQLKPRSHQPAQGIVTGELKEIDFGLRRITIVHVGTGRELRCSYEDAVEPMLLEHPRELIQVRGSVIRDDEGHPKSIQDVDYIHAVDLEPIRVGEFGGHNRRLRARKPFDLIPRFDEAEQSFFVEFPELDIEEIAETKEDLVNFLYDELEVLWKHYAEAADDALTPQAQILKRKMIDLFEEVPDAA